MHFYRIYLVENNATIQVYHIIVCIEVMMFWFEKISAISCWRMSLLEHFLSYKDKARGANCYISELFQKIENQKNTEKNTSINMTDDNQD